MGKISHEKQRDDILKSKLYLFLVFRGSPGSLPPSVSMAFCFHCLESKMMPRKGRQEKGEHSLVVNGKAKSPQVPTKQIKKTLAFTEGRFLCVE